MGIPTPFPTVGRGAGLKPSFVHKGFVAVLVFACTPYFGRFFPDGLTGCARLTPCSPKTSLVAHATYGFTHTDGLERVKGQRKCPLRVNTG